VIWVEKRCSKLNNHNQKQNHERHLAETVPALVLRSPAIARQQPVRHHLQVFLLQHRWTQMTDHPN